MSISPASTGVLGFNIWDQLTFEETPDCVSGWGNPSGMISCSHGDQAPMGCRINEEIVWPFASVTFPWWHLCSYRKHLASFLCFVHDVTALILPDNFMRTATVSNGVHQGLRQLINWDKQGNTGSFRLILDLLTHCCIRSDWLDFLYSFTLVNEKT